MDENRYTNDYYTNQNQMNQGAGKSEPEFLFGNAGNQLLPDLFNQFSAVADESSAGKTRKTEKTIRWIW